MLLYVLQFPQKGGGGTGWAERSKAATIYQSGSPHVIGDTKAQDVVEGFLSTLE
jgi:hypothetical protein